MEGNGPNGAAPQPVGPPGVECKDLTKSFRSRQVLHGVSFTAPMGAVTGFVGVNGAGKTTTMRCALGLIKPTSGEALVGGKHYTELEDPRHQVGAVLEFLGAHPGQTGLSYLEVLAKVAGVPKSRVHEVLEIVGLEKDAKRKTGRYSQGMRQRLALAGAMLGDPPILLLDEPTNGLDPLGIRWMRKWLRDRAEEGRCILVSSHQLAELEAVADKIVMIHQGRLISEEASSTADLAGAFVTVRTPQADKLAALAVTAGGAVTANHDETLVVSGMTVEQVGQLAATNHVVLYSLAEGRGGLEEMFLDLSGVEHAGEAPDGSARGGR
jgi:ABC-2 type transport system ATP-binding protein